MVGGDKKMQIRRGTRHGTREHRNVQGGNKRVNGINKRTGHDALCISPKSGGETVPRRVVLRGFEEKTKKEQKGKV